jgi:hypothetical protein
MTQENTPETAAAPTRTIRMAREIIPAVIEIVPKHDGTTGRTIRVLRADTPEGQALLEERVQILHEITRQKSQSGEGVSLPVDVEVLLSELGDDAEVLPADQRDAAIRGQAEGDAVTADAQPSEGEAA